MKKDDYAALSILGIIILIAVIVGAILAVMSHWLTGVFARLGAIEAPASWLAYVIVGVAGFIVVVSVMCRMTEERWPWQ